MNSNEEWMDALDTVFDEEESSVFKSEENLAVPTLTREFDYIEKAYMEVGKGNSRGKVVVEMTD